MSQTSQVPKTENKLQLAVLQLLEQDIAAAIEYLSSQPESEAEAVADCYLELQKHLYYEAKDLANLTLISAAGIQFTLSQAHRAPHSAYLLRSKAKALTYNLASYTWPGWDEPKLPISPVELAIGLSAARANLRLAHELDKGDLPISRAHWVIGAHQLAVAEWSAAIESFTSAVDHAQRADATADAQLSQGYIALTEILRQPTNADAQQRLSNLKAQLAQLEYGEFFVQQLDSALAIFKRDAWIRKETAEFAGFSIGQSHGGITGAACSRTDVSPSR